MCYYDIYFTLHDNGYELILLLYILTITLIAGDARTSRRPPTTQKWKRNEQVGGGAVIPRTWRLHVMKGPEQFKRVSNMVKTLRSVAESCEGLDDMVIRVR